MRHDVDVSASRTFDWLPESAARIRVEPVALLCAVTFAIFVPFAMLNPLLPEIAAGLGVSISVVGQLNTATMISSAFIALVIGTLSDVYGRRPFLVAGLALVGVGTIGLSLAPTFAWALLTRVLVGAGAIFPVALALAGDWYQGEQRNRVVARMLGVASIAWVLGAPAASSGAQLLGWRGTIGAFGVLFLMMAALGLFVLPRERQRLESRNLRDALGGILSVQRQQSDVALLLMSSAARSVRFSGILTYIGAFYKDELVIETWQLGPMLALGAAAFYVGSEMVGRWNAQLGSRNTMAIALLLTGITNALLVLAPRFAPLGLALPLCLTLWAASCTLDAIAFAGLIALLLRLAGETRGATMALNNSLGNVGSAIGAAACGIGLALSGYTGVGGIALIAAIVAMAFVLLADRHIVDTRT
jgi:predicted MFS family arabinose efflux permease